jgi:hypothetical protein
MLPLGEMLGPFGPEVARRHGEPSSQAERIRSRILAEMGMGPLGLFSAGAIILYDAARQTGSTIS